MYNDHIFGVLYNLHCSCMLLRVIPVHISLCKLHFYNKVDNFIYDMLRGVMNTIYRHTRLHHMGGNI